MTLFALSALYGGGDDGGGHWGTARAGNSSPPLGKGLAVDAGEVAELLVEIALALGGGGVEDAEESLQPDAEVGAILGSAVAPGVLEAADMGRGDHALSAKREKFPCGGRLA